MFLSKDYSQVTLDELVSEEKKLSSQNVATAFVIGAVIGVVFYAIIQKNYIIACILVIVTTFFGYRHSQNLKEVKAEIRRRNAGR